jgi:hypothetical protein
MEQKGTITIQLDERGELLYVDIDGRKLTEPTHNLYDRVPPGVLKGFGDVGKIYTYERPDGTLMRCVKRPNCSIW